MSHHAVVRGPRLALLALALLALVAACTSAAAPAAAPADGNPPEAPALQPGAGGTTDQSNGGGQRSSSGGGTTAAQYDVSRPDLLIIKTGTMSLQVTGVDDALATASGKIAALGGYVSGSDRKGDGDQLVATVTYRIPASQWDAALVALRGIADKVLAEQTQTQDVTGDVLDLGARITNLKATEAALQAIMAKATKISDVLDVQQQLTDVRGQIEQLSTQKSHLEAQAAYSTLTVSFSLKPAPAVVTSQQKFDPNSEIDKASASLVDVLQALATAGIWFAIVWLPILLALAVIAGVVALVIRRFIPRRAAIVPAPPSEGAPA